MVRTFLKIQRRGLKIVSFLATVRLAYQLSQTETLSCTSVVCLITYRPDSRQKIAQSKVK